MIKRLLKNATVKNAGWLIFGKIAQMLISLIVGLITARYLGPSNYGIINYAAAYTSFFMAVCTLGINSVLVKEFIDHPEEEGQIIGSSLLLRAVSSVLSACMIMGIVSLVDAGEKTIIIVTALCSLSLIFNIFETFNYWFQAHLCSKVTAIATLSAYVVSSLYKIILLILHKSVEWFAFSLSLDYVVLGVLLFGCYRKYGGRELSFSATVSKRILRKSVYFILPGVMVSIYSYADKFMLKQMLNETEVGYYATAVTLCGMWTFILTAVIDSMYPAIMESHKIDKELFKKKNRRLYALVFYLSVAMSALFCVFGDWIVLLLYGEAYLPAAMPLRIVTWYTAFSYMGVARNAWIVCEDKQKFLKYIYVSSAVCNVALNLLFIPRWGTSGAAAATLVTQILTTVIIPFFIKDLRNNSVLILEGIFLKGIR